MRASLSHAPDRVLATVGGSSSTDGCSGDGRALGYRFLRADRRGDPRRRVGLLQRAHVDARAVNPSWPEQGAAARGVTNPLLGRQGAASVDASRKGQTPRRPSG